MFTLPSPLLFLAAILLFPVVLVGSMVLDASEAQLEEHLAR